MEKDVRTCHPVNRFAVPVRLGADAVLAVVPYYSKPSPEGIIEHYRQLARVGVPVVAYEIPARTGVRLSAETVKRIFDIDGVIGLKDSSGDTALTAELTRGGETKPILCGDDLLFHAMLSQGASGGILASANWHTPIYLEAYRRFAAGDVQGAKRTFDLLVPYIRLLFRESNPAPLKRVLARQGLIASDHLRLPMVPVSDELRAELDKAFKGA
ncbi:dihydrodipicolinate synthase family protein [Cohnella suwonensis]|uniref:Dihydrodipicolinate synthase family protein n=1 Tax=Cohnella suwonensis TaxID=696072 RepID=A0ABW0M121_9BACL